MDGSRELGGLRDTLARAERVAVLTGAGASSASGLATFRGAGGLWRGHRAEDLATPEAYARDPALVWAWYYERFERVAAAGPNRAHALLAELEARSQTFTLVTQNVDGLHQRAGSQNVVNFTATLQKAAANAAAASRC
jgi:NAD-dependent deacetylase